MSAFLMPAGLISLICLILLLILAPLLFMEAIVLALYKLGFPPLGGAFVMLSMFSGSLVNLPVKRYPVNGRLPTNHVNLFGVDYLIPRFAPRFAERVIAVNVGGCIVPVIIVVYQVIRMMDVPYMLVYAMLASAVNIVACFSLSRVLPGVGIVLPAFFPGILAAACALILSPGHTAPVAFCAGVLGPLIGADLLHINDLRKSNAGVFSIGGAGTFDGIVISGILAVLIS